MVLLGFLLLTCKSTKKRNQETIILGSGQNAAQEYSSDNHSYISQNPDEKTPILSNPIDSLSQSDTGTVENETITEAILETASPVAQRIVENYLNSTNKEPGGHCLTVNKGRFVQAYKEVHGHLPYRDLPKGMATSVYTSKQVFNLLYATASDIHEGWRSLPEEYRGKGNAGALVYAGMGSLVDTNGIWSGQLKPGALMQVWRFKEDYEQVVQGVDVKKLDPYGHSFIFISYMRDENNTITGLQIADQGYQSYRPLVPRDYQVWWAVNLII